MKQTSVVLRHHLLGIKSGFIWRYAQYADLDQYVSANTIRIEAPEAPAALAEALENFIGGSRVENGIKPVGSPVKAGQEGGINVRRE